ncbi:hypothetical protein [Thiohalorhabdus sp.]|uniref:hypothetical protein n=1 Tax=Thiohalorhabdus sp. TaxID=3094134 RepID=UPI002FC2D078
MSNSFLTNLNTQRGGALMDELGDEYRDLIAAVRETGKKGKLTLELEVKPGGGEDNEVIHVKDNVKMTVPEHDRKPSVYFSTQNNELTRQHPEQQELPVQDATPGVETQAAPKEVPEAEAGPPKEAGS